MMSELSAQFALVIFTRWPEPGRTKTRLIPEFGADGAADIHRQLIDRTFAAARDLTESTQVLVALADAASADVSSINASASWPIIAQHGDDLGERMANAINEAFERCPSAESVVLIGVDCPDYSAALFRDAAAVLNVNDTVFAPAEDGGYGLVGVAHRAWQPALRRALFSGLDWGSSSVMQQTQIRLNAVAPQATLALLPVLWDIDHPADVHRAIRLRQLRLPCKTPT